MGFHCLLNFRNLVHLPHHKQSQSKPFRRKLHLKQQGFLYNDQIQVRCHSGLNQLLVLMVMID